MAQMKEPDKTPEKELTEMEIRNIPDTKFKTLIIRVLKELMKRLDELGENFDKEIRNIRKNQSEMKITITEMSIH